MIAAGTQRGVRTLNRPSGPSFLSVCIKQSTAPVNADLVCERTSKFGSLTAAQCLRRGQTCIRTLICGTDPIMPGNTNVSACVRQFGNDHITNRIEGVSDQRQRNACVTHSRRSVQLPECQNTKGGVNQRTSAGASQEVLRRGERCSSKTQKRLDPNEGSRRTDRFVVRCGVASSRVPRMQKHGARVARLPSAGEAT